MGEGGPTLDCHVPLARHRQGGQGRPMTTKMWTADDNLEVVLAELRNEGSTAGLCWVWCPRRHIATQQIKRLVALEPKNRLCPFLRIWRFYENEQQFAIRCV